MVSFNSPFLVLLFYHAFNRFLIETAKNNNNNNNKKKLKNSRKYRQENLSSVFSYVVFFLLYFWVPEEPWQYVYYIHVCVYY